MKLDDLPDDVIVLISSRLTIPSVFSLRLVCRSTCAAIDVYISTIALAVARNTFPGCSMLLDSSRVYNQHQKISDHQDRREYDIPWLKSLIPAQLASITLDKDKLRRHPYVNAGFPYGIPSQSTCAEAIHWRGRVANGWCVLRKLYLVSKDMYGSSVEELSRIEKGNYGKGLGVSRPKMWKRKVSGSKVWQVISCQEERCAEHGMKNMFERRKSEEKSIGDGDLIKMGYDRTLECGEAANLEALRRRERLILKRRLAYIETLREEDLRDYTYLWRLLSWTFRPYRKPSSTLEKDENDYDLHERTAANWSSIVHDMTLGFSWLNWYILHIGPTPFLQQWWPATTSPPSLSSNPNAHTLRDLIWTAHSSSTPHAISLHRKHISKLEFALRKRCLTQERLSRLLAELQNERVVRTISLNCIPWVYDQHFAVMKMREEFPWYGEGEMVWFDGNTWFLTSERGERRSGARWGIVKRRGNEDSDEGEDEKRERDPLRGVPYLVYLGIDDSSTVWDGGEGVGDVLDMKF